MLNSRRSFLKALALSSAFKSLRWPVVLAQSQVQTSPTPIPTGNFHTDFLTRTITNNVMVITGINVTLDDFKTSAAGEPDALTADLDLYVFAETITLNKLSISLYGRNVFLHCRTLICPALDSAASTASPIVNVSGVPGIFERPVTGIQQSPASDGVGSSANGASGSNGQPGTNSGNITIYCGELRGFINLWADGGEGTNGQGGGRGQNGAPGNPGASHTDVSDCRNGDPGAPGGTGGNGGKGGKGGDGGSAGTIQIFTLTDTSNVTENNCLFTTRTCFQMESMAGIPGDGGPGGLGALGGSGGPGGRSGVLSHQGEHYSCGLAGLPPGPFGNKGADGKAGLLGQGGNYGNSGQETAKQLDLKSFYQYASISQMQMFFHSISKTYLASTGSISDTFNSIGPNLRGLVSALADLSACSLCPAIALGCELAPTQSEVQALFQRATLLLSQLNAGLDYFGYPLNYVPRVALEYYEPLVKPLLTNLAAIEQTKATYDKNRNDHQSLSLGIQASITQVTQDNAKKETQSSQLQSYANDLNNSIYNMTSALIIKQQQLEVANKAFSDAVSAQLGTGCTLTQGLAFIAAVVTVAEGNYSNSAGIVKSVAAISQAATQGEKLITEMQTATNQVASASQAYNSIKNAADSDSPSDKILMSDSDFQSLIKPFYKLVPSQAAGLADALDAYVELAKSRNQTLLSYTALMTQKAQLDATIQADQEEIARLQNLMLRNQDPTLAAYAAFFGKLSTEQKAGVVRVLYEEGRALNYWSLTTNNIPIDDTDSITLGGVQDSIYNSQLAALNNRGRPSQPGKVSINLGSTEYPQEFAAFSKTGKLTISIPSTRKEFQSDMAQIYVTGIWVEVPGVATTSNGLLTIALSHNGTSSFVKPDTKDVVVYQHQPVPVQIQYAIANPPVSITTAVQNNLGTSETVFTNGTQVGTQQAFSFVSPFATWTIAILAEYNGGTQPDLSKVESVNVTFWIQFQPFTT